MTACWPSDLEPLNWEFLSWRCRSRFYFLSSSLSSFPCSSVPALSSCCRSMIQPMAAPRSRSSGYHLCCESLTASPAASHPEHLYLRTAQPPWQGLDSSRCFLCHYSLAKKTQFLCLPTLFFLPPLYQNHRCLIVKQFMQRTGES